MLKLASVSLPFGKKSQARQNQSSHTPVCPPAQPPPPDAGPAETSLGLPTSHTNSGSVSLKRRYQLIHFKLAQSPSTPAAPSKPINTNSNNCAEPPPNNSSPSSSSAPKTTNQLAPPHTILPSAADTDPSETTHSHDPLNPQASKPNLSRLRSSSSSSLHTRHPPHPPLADPDAMAASGNLYEHDPSSQPFSSAFNPPSVQPSNIINYNNQQLSLLRRHHTLSTAGTHLARLEKEHALAHMVEKDRRFYGGSDCETGSLSGSESLESLSLESRSNFCLTPLESDHHHYPHREQPRVLSELSDLIAQPQPPPPSRGTPLPQSGFQLIRAYKGTASLRSQHLGPPSYPLSAGAQSQLNGTAVSAITTASHSTTTPTAVPSHPKLANQLNTAANNCQSHIPTIEHHPGPQSAQVSVSLPSNSPVALHRNFSSPSKLQHCSTSPAATIRPSHPSNSYLLSPSWKRVSLLNSALMKPTDSAMHLLHTLQPTRSLSDGSRTLSQATEEEPEDQAVGSCSATSHLHRATSDRVSSTNVNSLNASQPPSSNALSQWSEQSNLRRHQSLKSDGKWGTCLITSPTAEASSEQDTFSLKDSSRTQLDTFYEFGSSIETQSTDLLRSSSHLSNSSAAFHKSISSNKSSNSNIGSFSQTGGIVTTMSSPVGVPGLSINPWSPSVEEAKKLREPMLRQASLDTLASHSSNGSHPMQKSNTTDLSRYRSSSNDDTQGREVNLLHTNFGRMNLGQSKNGEDLAGRSTKGLSHRVSGIKSPLSTSTSLAELSEPATSDVEPTKPITTAKKVALPPLVTDFSRVTSIVGQKPVDSVKRHPNGVSLLFQGPASAAAFVPPIGHSLSRNISDPFNFHEKMALMANRNTAAPGIGASNWLTQKERLVGDSQSRQQTGEWGSPHSRSPSTQTPTTSLQNLPQQIHQQMILNQQLQQIQQLQAQQQQLQQQQVQLLNSTMGLSATSANGSNPPLMNNLLQNSSFNNYISPATTGALFGNINASNPVSAPAPNPSRLQTTITGLPGLPSLSGASPLSASTGTIGIGPLGGANVMNMGQPMPLMANLGLPGSHPFSVQELARQKGYNPINFDVSPKSCRFFVIKSYTEEDVHKSLKYEIWASTDLGNKRLDRAFHESHESGPIYLLFSVNASGHFCGMAEMLTAVDYNTTSKVWAQDKWKGIFKVRWVFVKDIPNNALRHIKLTNTPENKPITSSRDTQEVPHDKGVQVLQIMSSYQSRTTLLQDYAWYEHNESLKSQQQQTVETTNQVSVTLQGKSKNQSQIEASNGSTRNRHYSENLVQNSNQNIRRFTHAQHHPGQMAPVTVQVASGI